MSMALPGNKTVLEKSLRDCIRLAPMYILVSGAPLDGTMFIPSVFVLSPLKIQFSRTMVAPSSVAPEKVARSSALVKDRSYVPAL